MHCVIDSATHIQSLIQPVQPAIPDSLDASAEQELGSSGRHGMLQWRCRRGPHFLAMYSQTVATDCTPAVTCDICRH